MLRTLLATTALATLISGAAFAQETTTTTPPATTAPAADQAAPAMKADGYLASNLIGETVYNGTGDDAENIGEVNDVVIGTSGQTEAIVVGVGGFLGLGEKNVAIPFADLDWAERDGDRWIVVAATKEQLETQAEFDVTAYEPAVSTATAPAASGTGSTETGASGTDATAMAPAAPADPAAPTGTNSTAMAPDAPAASGTDTTAMTTEEPAGTVPAPAPATGGTPQDTTAAAPADTSAATDQTQTAAIDRSTLTEMPAGDIRAEDLVGTTVYGANDANLGEIGDIVLTQDSKIDAVIIDVGGFLGMGAKEVAVGMDKLAFMTDADNNKYLYTTFTKEQLDSATAYDEATWADSRDQQRLMMQ